MEGWDSPDDEAAGHVRSSRLVLSSRAKRRICFDHRCTKTRAAGNARLDRIITAPDVLPRALFQFCDALIIGSCEKSGEKSVYVIPSYRLP